jgi:hypothetical protein
MCAIKKQQSYMVCKVATKIVKDVGQCSPYRTLINTGLFTPWFVVRRLECGIHRPDTEVSRVNTVVQFTVA